MPGGFETTDVAAHVGAPVQSPLETIGQLANVRNALNQNKMFPLQFQAQQLSNQTAQQGLQTARIAALQGALASTKDASEVPDVVSRYVQAGLIDPDTAAGILGGNVSGFDAASLAVRRRQAIMQAGNATEVEGEFGTPTPVQTGAGTQFVNVNRMSGQVASMQGAGAFIQNALGAKDLATPVETVDESGTKTMGVLGDYINPNGSWKDGVPHPMTALGPTSQAVQATLGAAYGPQIAEFEHSAPQIAAGRQAVENLRAEGAQFAAGPQSDFWKHMGELASEYGVHLVPPADSSETAAREAYAKNLTLVLSAQQKALHMDSTDASRQTAELSVPSEQTTPEGRNRALAVIEGNLDAQNAMLQAWEKQKAKGGDATWGQFQVEFPSKVPPSIFQAQYMTSGEIATMQKGWSPARKALWQRRYDAAAKQGWLPNAQ